MRNFSTITVVFICAGMLFSCSNKNKTEITVEFANQIWNRFAPLEGVFMIENIKKQYEIKVALSVINGFAYDQIPLEIVITSPSGQTNVLNKIVVIKDKEDKHIGNVVGDVWTIEQVIYSHKEFTEEGEYAVSVQNRTQYYELFKVKSLSFTVTSLNKKKTE
jgi:gliding motility-associated lipoprotein GldH